jgi:ribosome-associated heat shock protein Hsp15
MSGSGQEDRDWQRLDKWLWCARFMKTRSDCARLVGEGFVRINRQPTEKPHARLRVGDVVTLPIRGQVRVARVLALPARRGPATEAALLYQEIEEPVQEAGVPCTAADSSAYRPPLTR